MVHRDESAKQTAFALLENSNRAASLLVLLVSLLSFNIILWYSVDFNASLCVITTLLIIPKPSAMSGDIIGLMIEPLIGLLILSRKHYFQGTEFFWTMIY